jgi:hypothetical protein
MSQGEQGPIVAGNQSIIITNSTVRDIKYTVHTEPSLKTAIDAIAATIRSSGNVEAAKSWELFQKELQGKKSKSKLAALWHHIVKLVPDISKLAESAAAIDKVFT